METACAQNQFMLPGGFFVLFYSICCFCFGGMCLVFALEVPFLNRCLQVIGMKIHCISRCKYIHDVSISEVHADFKVTQTASTATDSS